MAFIYNRQHSKAYHVRLGQKGGSKVVGILMTLCFMFSMNAQAGVCIDYRSVAALASALNTKSEKPATTGKITPRYAQARPQIPSQAHPVEKQYLGDGIWMPEPAQINQSQIDQDAYAKSRAAQNQSILRKQEAAKRPKTTRRTTTTQRTSQTRSPSATSVAKTIASKFGGGSCSGICF